ncbi:MAG: hypothetical protein Q8O93_00395 [bacterium]|nr:hypothetical protein [bacterium]
MINISENTIKDAEQKIKTFAQFNDFQGAYLYYKDLTEAVKSIGDEDKKNNQLFFDKINREIFKLKFIALNYFDDWEEIGELIEKYFDLALQLKYYDPWEKIKVNLLYISDLRERDKAKELIKIKLLNSDCRILDANKYKNIKDLPVTVAGWLKNYHAHLGLKKVDNLKRIEYLTNSQFIKPLSGDDKNKLKILFNFYEKIKIPSSDRLGFEGEVPMVIDGENVIFSNGEAETIPANIFKMIQEVKVVDNISLISRVDSDIDELKQLAAKYPAGSFERKAVEEEIERVTRSPR